MGRESGSGIDCCVDLFGCGVGVADGDEDALGVQGGDVLGGFFVVRREGDEFDEVIGEIVKEPETELNTERLVLRAAIRQVKNDALKQELSQLFASGLSSDEIGLRYRELTALQDQLLREAQAELANR